MKASTIRLFKNIFKPNPENAEFRTRKNPNQRLIIEIGCGVGLHPIQYAQQHSNDFLIAIEKTREKFQKFEGRVAHHPELKNLYPVHANATHWIAQNIQPNEVDEYFMLYPNPYPKAKHKNKRFMHMPFMAYLIETLKPGGRITLATNEKFYYEEAKQAFTETWGLTLVSDTLLAPSTSPRTHFEKKYLARGEPCYNLQFFKNPL